MHQPSKKMSRPPFLQMLLFITTTLMAITTAEARSPVPYRYSPVHVEIIDDRGRVFRQIATDSHSSRVKRAYVEAKRSKRYSLRIKNTSNRRVGVVIAVDGRNILTGKKSWLGKNEKMYILNPYETTLYKGWRTGKNRINRFFFTESNQSYASAWQDKSAMGVIALAVFNEKPRIMYRQDNNFNNNKRARSAPSSSLRADDTGTGFGREEYSPTIKVHFKPQHQAISKHFYKYEWRASLCRRGIINCYERPRKPHNRFWPEESYAPYPPGMTRDYYRGN